MDALYMGCLIAWQCGDFIAHLYLSGLYLALEATDFMLLEMWQEDVHRNTLQELW